ncbi:MAG: hypothetical protein K9M99_01310 [Candidatus Cloacimonetes bacterium]|nr:hypothetical protein [Candidatus Cloacimonadota bacterium]
MKKIFSVLFICGLSACTLYNSGSSARPAGFSEILLLNTNIAVEKACYNSLKQVTYIWESNTEKIHIFKQNKQINTIGGEGFDRANFQKLTDICLSPDGDIFALDSPDRSLKKFDEKGELRAVIKIDADLSPLLVAVALDQKIYVYGDKRKEIVVLNYKGKELEAFGSMQFYEPASLELYNDLIAVYEPLNDITVFFSRLGQVVDEQKGHCYIENRQVYCAGSFFLQQVNGQNKFAVNTSPWQKVFFQSPEIILSDGNKLLVGMIKYDVQR